MVLACRKINYRNWVRCIFVFKIPSTGRPNRTFDAMRSRMCSCIFQYDQWPTFQRETPHKKIKSVLGHQQNTHARTQHHTTLELWFLATVASDDHQSHRQADTNVTRASYYKYGPTLTPGVSTKPSNADSSRTVYWLHPLVLATTKVVWRGAWVKTMMMRPVLRLILQLIRFLMFFFPGGRLVPAFFVFFMLVVLVSVSFCRCASRAG